MVKGVDMEQQKLQKQLIVMQKMQLSAACPLWPQGAGEEEKKNLSSFFILFFFSLCVADVTFLFVFFFLYMYLPFYCDYFFDAVFWM